MKHQKAKRIKGHVVITLRNDDAGKEVTLIRKGRLGLASPTQFGRAFKPRGQQLRGLPVAPKGEPRRSVSPSQPQGGLP